MLLRKIRFIALLIVFVWSAFLIASGHGKTNTMTIDMPAEVIKHSIQDILPMKLEDAGKHIQGKLYLHSINELTMKDNSAVIRGLIIGRDVSVVTKVGKQDLRIKFGNLHLPLTCDLAFRFDAQAKTLYVQPQLRPPKQGELTDMESSVVSLLAVFDDKEYPVSLSSMKGLNAKVGNQDISVNMEPVDIRVQKGKLIVKMIPILSKTN